MPLAHARVEGVITEYGDMLYLMGTAAADKAVAWDLLAMGACLAVGAVALRLVQLWREDRRRAARRWRYW